jgi:hypothetical protein
VVLCADVRLISHDKTCRAEQDLMKFKLCDEIELDTASTVQNLSGWFVTISLKGILPQSRVPWGVQSRVPCGVACGQSRVPCGVACGQSRGPCGVSCGIHYRVATVLRLYFPGPNGWRLRLSVGRDPFSY